MITKQRSWLLWAGAIFIGLCSPSAYALSCFKNGATSGAANALEQIAIPALAIPGDTPAGTKIWESEVISVTAHCGDVSNSSIDYENVYFYFNPRGPNLDPAYGLAFGIEVISPVHQELDNPAQKFDTGYTVYRRATQGPTWINVPVAFRLYLKTTVMPNNGGRPITGNYGGPATFEAFQFDGKLGVNSVQGRNLRYDLINLTNIKFLACGADIIVLPDNQDVNFGSVSPSTINNVGEINRNFTLRAIRRGCADNFTIDMRLDPKTPTVNAQHLDLQNGLQIGIYAEGKRIEFGKYYPFGTLGANATFDKEFVAKLTRISGQEIKVGPFRAGLVYRINYK